MRGIIVDRVEPRKFFCQMTKFRPDTLEQAQIPADYRPGWVYQLRYPKSDTV